MIDWTQLNQWIYTRRSSLGFMWRGRNELNMQCRVSVFVSLFNDKKFIRVRAESNGLYSRFIQNFSVVKVDVWVEESIREWKKVLGDQARGVKRPWRVSDSRSELKEARVQEKEDDRTTSDATETSAGDKWNETIKSNAKRNSDLIKVSQNKTPTWFMLLIRKYEEAEWRAKHTTNSLCRTYIKRTA